MYHILSGVNLVKKAINYNLLLYDKDYPVKHAILGIFYNFNYEYDNFIFPMVIFYI